jgi:hypothetical protein
VLARAALRGIALASITTRGGRRMRQWHWFSLVLVVAVAGCASRREPVTSVQLTSAPVGYESYPEAYYDGRTVYWVNNEWAYPEGGVWFAYRSEPFELRRFREGGFRGGFEHHGEGRGGHEGHGGFRGGGERGGGEHGGGEHGGGEHGGGGHGGGGHGGGGHGGGGGHR